MNDHGHQVIRVKKLAVVLPACDGGRHLRHPDMTCAEADAQIAQVHTITDGALGRALRTFAGPSLLAKEAADAVD